MNILYLTKLTGNPWSGTSYCIPEQIHAQSKIDNVMWLNLNHTKKEEWIKEEFIFHNIDTIEPEISKLPAPFNNPDLVVVQQFYDYPFSPVIKELQKLKIPYIIQPHGELNKTAQRKKRLKKIIGNLLWFNRMIKRSIAIEYLTENEYENSAWHDKEHLVIPNGIVLPDYQKKENPICGIKASFIGRLSIYHKGLDILLEGISLAKDELSEAGFRLNIFGHNQDGAKEQIEKIIEEKRIQNIVSVNEGVYGDDKINTLKNTDLFILTSRYEGHPIALLEALSYGVPCLVTPGTNMDKMVDQYDAGWCTKFDATAISNALKEIIVSKQCWTQKSENARRLSTIYSWDTIVQKAHEEYKTILEEIRIQ